MGQKYMIYGFNYDNNAIKTMKQTKWFIVALYWMCVFFIQFDGVDIMKRD